MGDVSLKELSLEVERLKKIVFDLQERDRDDYLTYEEGLVFDRAMDNLRQGKTYTQEDVNNAREKAGFRV